MKVGSSLGLRFCLPALLISIAGAQVSPANPPASVARPVPYSSVNEVNMLLSELEQASQAAQVDLAKLRIDKWKTDSNTKRGTQTDVESIQRNLQTALPEMISQLRNSPDNLNLNFKLYRNLDALYDVFASVVESAGAFGSRDEFQSLQNDLNALQKSRRSFADRMQALADTKEGELAQLRTQLQNAQAAANAAPPKKVVVDDTEAPKKPPAKKKSAAKSSKSNSPNASSQKTGNGAQPQQQNPPPSQPQ